jgi:hypothetical protein
MNVKVQLRDVLRDAVAWFGCKFPYHEIVDFSETVHPDIAENAGGSSWACDDGFPLVWHFVLEKEEAHRPGPGRVEVDVNPISDIVFARVREQVEFDLHFADEPLTLRVQGAEVSVRNGWVSYTLLDYEKEAMAAHSGRAL